MGNSKVYEAKVLRNKMEGGKSLRPIEQIVKDTILVSNTELKKEDIDAAVATVIGKELELSSPLDDSIVAAVSSALKKLESEKVVKHSSHGYWERG